MTTPCHVLVIEDDDDVRESLVDVLSQFGHSVLVASNGAEGLRCLEESTTMPGLILLDLMMPVMDGYSFREAQRADARWASIPVVVLSAHAATDQRGAELAVNAVFKKPIGVSAIRDIVTQHCRAAG